MTRKTTRKVKVGNIYIGGEAPVVIQSMTSTPTVDIEATVKQIRALTLAGCELVRVGVPDMDSALAIARIKKQVDIPIVADIHFDYKLALASIEAGADKIRINPVNIGTAWKVRELVLAAKERGVPIRIGVNSGSIKKSVLERCGGATASAMVESAREEIRILEDMDFFDIVVSLKASDIHRTIEANRIFSSKFDYPIHLGITEAGLPFSGAIRSAVGIGALLLEGIGDTIRVSLSADPVLEIRAAKEILKSTGARNDWITILACPTCARCLIDVVGIAEELEKLVGNLKVNLTVAVMGCEVNGPGEAKEADIGIAGTRDGALLFVMGKAMRKIKKDELLPALVETIKDFAGKKTP
jgi:(E)-4-hydroxy-3-methylbut-2-enyl-diphosphate synthase